MAEKFTLSARWLIGVILAAGWVLLATANPSEAQTADPIGLPASRDLNTLPQIEVRAQRRSVEKRVQAFIAAVTPKTYAYSLVRWNQGLCPVIVGPSSDQTERILAHVTQIAALAGVAIQPKPCQANLYIVASANPERLLSAWGKRDHLLFGGAGSKAIDAFLNTSRPVRVWYNTVSAAARQDHLDPERFGALAAPSGTLGSAVPGSGAGADALSGSGAANAAALASASADAAQAASFLNFSEVESFTSVIVVVDTKLAGSVKLDQLSDYLAIVGLSKVNLDADFGAVPTILSIFAPSIGATAEPAPASITSWDRDYLKALYATRQSSRRQRLEIADMMVRERVR